MIITINKDVFSSDQFLKENFESETAQHVQTFLKFWKSKEEEYILHTSGSTGKPKAITITKEQMRMSAEATIRFFNLHAGKTALLCLGVDRVAGVMMIVRALMAQMDLLLVEPKSNPLKDIHTEVAFAAMVPYQVKTILEETPEKFSFIRDLIIGGAPLLRTERQQLIDLGVDAFETYGMTETVSHIALKHISERDFKFLHGTTGHLDKRGCLVIRTLLSDEDIITNDVVEFTDYNSFIWKGRADFVINSGGVKIHPEELERKLETLFSKNGEHCHFFITSEKDNDFGEKVVLFLENPSCFQEEWLAELPTYVKPKKVYKLDAFKWTESGKVDRVGTSSF